MNPGTFSRDVETSARSFQISQKVSSRGYPAREEKEKEREREREKRAATTNGRQWRQLKSASSLPPPFHLTSLLLLPLPILWTSGVSPTIFNSRNAITNARDMHFRGLSLASSPARRSCHPRATRVLPRHSSSETHLAMWDKQRRCRKTRMKLE